MSAIYIMWLRQLKRYIRSKARLVGSLGQPVLFFLALGFGFGPIYQKAGGGNYIDFLVPGIVAMSIIFFAFFSGIELIWDRQFGFLKETLVAPVSRTQIMIGRTLGGATVATIQGILVFLISLAIGFRPDSVALLPLALGFMFLIAFIFTILGTAIASLMNDMQGFPVIVNFLVMPLFFLSGALFPLDGLPASIRVITYGDPLSYGIDGLRATLASAHHFPVMLDAGVLIGITLLFLGIGTYMFSKIEV
jgi:ABC-2 type transport system permease protein